MDLADEARGYEEALGAPERVVEVGAVGLELRGQPAVQHEVPAAGRSHHLSPRPGCCSSCWALWAPPCARSRCGGWDLGFGFGFRRGEDL